MSRCLLAIDDPEDFIRGWFYGAPLELIRRENIREWLTWAMFGSDKPEIEDLEAWTQESEQYLQAMEGHFTWTIQQGRTKDLPVMKLTVDPVHIVSRPLLWYIVSRLLYCLILTTKSWYLIHHRSLL